MSELPEGIRPAVLTYPQASEYLGISTGRLRNLKWLGLAPRSVTYGKRDVRFRIADLDEWLAMKAGVMPAPEPARKRPKRPRQTANCSNHDFGGRIGDRSTRLSTANDSLGTMPQPWKAIILAFLGRHASWLVGPKQLTGQLYSRIDESLPQ
ncbi:helix-turn-helix transcriptional regulator [Acetobacter aceti]|uniref:Helix-turn-helix domain-containing protein n=1 Tax=Acetobacter aceti TaxID=435 RepID=A0A6S6PF27_ACEAC|nr:helix-turn-helix domain-containing protein [Acetobacter aceti]BCI65863.1 hypothetical protein AAJCM20276_04870 [Acetobacter aceti]